MIATQHSIDSILERTITEDIILSKEDILALLNIETLSSSYYKLLHASMGYSRKTFGNEGYLFAQVGINAEPCSVNCKFCSLGENHYAMKGAWEKTDEEILEEVADLVNQNEFSDLFLMTTADFSFERFLSLSTKVKASLPDSMRLVVNIGDFVIEQAIQLKEAGISGVYHINRLREGIDTDAKVEDRERTIAAIRETGLELYYCIEPIGPEHRYEEIIVEIERAREKPIEVMAVMRRTPVEGTPLGNLGKVTSAELTKIAAVVNLAVRPTRAMNVHEPSEMSLLAGINQLYAESGSNPRDNSEATETNRGFSVQKARELLKESGWINS